MEKAYYLLVIAQAVTSGNRQRFQTLEKKRFIVKRELEHYASAKGFTAAQVKASLADGKMKRNKQDATMYIVARKVMANSFAVVC